MTYQEAPEGYNTYITSVHRKDVFDEVYKIMTKAQLKMFIKKNPIPKLEGFTIWQYILIFILKPIYFEQWASLSIKDMRIFDGTRKIRTLEESVELFKKKNKLI